MVKDSDVCNYDYEKKIGNGDKKSGVEVGF